MARLFSIFLILSLIIIYGQIDNAMFNNEKSTIQTSENKISGKQNSSEAYAVSELDECCADKNKNLPMKVSYCHLDSVLNQSGIEYNFPSSKQLNLPGSCRDLISREPAFPLRPPIA